MEIFVCVGSSCHLKGSHHIIDLLRERLEKDGLSSKVSLKATFCLGYCGSNGVNMKVDGEIVTGINDDNFEKIYQENIVNKLK